jgi:hypothetical protein
VVSVAVEFDTLPVALVATSLALARAALALGAIATVAVVVAGLADLFAAGSGGVGAPNRRQRQTGNEHTDDPAAG